MIFYAGVPVSTAVYTPSRLGSQGRFCRCTVQYMEWKREI